MIVYGARLVTNYDNNKAVIFIWKVPTTHPNDTLIVCSKTPYIDKY